MDDQCWADAPGPSVKPPIQGKVKVFSKDGKTYFTAECYRFGSLELEVLHTSATYTDGTAKKFYSYVVCHTSWDGNFYTLCQVLRGEKTPRFTDLIIQEDGSLRES